jgi:hypothetical protein
MKEEILIDTQLALFFEQPLSHPDEYYQSFNAEMGGIFDTIPTILPVPNETQLLDVPIVQMNSNNGVFSCNIARGRVDFFYRGAGKQTFIDIKADLLIKLEKYFNFFADKVKIKRFGFVTRFFIEDAGQDKTIARLLDDNFTKLHNGVVNEVFIRYVSKTKINEFDINNLSSIERFSARIKDMGGNIRGVLLTRDFNTVPNISYSDKFNLDKIKKIIEEGEEKFKLDDIKNVLWPKN